jgi:glucan 1,3-beta-glucosidase
LPPPTYYQYNESEFINVKTVPGYPVYGDGVTDDTDNLNYIASTYAGGYKILFFPAGTYIVTNTIFFPVGSKVMGEVWSAISATSSIFWNASAPVPMVQVGNPGDVGIAQFSDFLFTVADVLQGKLSNNFIYATEIEPLTKPGCTLLEVNVAGNSPGDVGFWNTHFRVGGAAGSLVETNCTGLPDTCKAAYMLLHLTNTSSVYVDNMWGRLASVYFTSFC